MTAVQRVAARAAQREHVDAGEIVDIAVDRVYLQDGNTPTVARLFAEHGFDRVWDAERIGVFFDHGVLPASAGVADRIAEASAFAARFGLRAYARGAGISHVVALEEGWFEPGGVVVGADSHTCTGGLMQALALGMGASDVVAIMLTGRTWFAVPETISLVLRGTPSRHAGPKDVMLYLLARYGQGPFIGRSVEYGGPWVESLAPDAAATLANMAVELGAVCCFVSRGPGRSGLESLGTYDGALALDVDLDDLPPFVARPGSPSAGVPLDACAGEPVEHVFVGSCANARLDDVAEIARVLAGAQVDARTHLVVTPGSRAVYLAALAAGYVETVVRAGGLVTPPGCGACVGAQGSIPASGANVLTTMNRNFKGRMGNPAARIWLSSPTVAANAALLGRFPRTDELR